MTKKFSIPLTQDPRKVIATLKTTADKNGVHFVGDHQLGHFRGKGIEGRYDIHEEVLTITIVKKPMLLGWPLIEAKLRDFLISHS